MAIPFRVNSLLRPWRLEILQPFALESRNITSTTVCCSGHNRWSKIKHDKKKDDAIKSKERSIIAQELRKASRLYGPDLNSNPRLATLVAFAKKSGFPKAGIESAIARGQGKSVNGQSLQSMMVEAMIPPSIAIIIESQTDSKLRTLGDIRLAVKDFGGAMTKTSHLFRRKGRIMFGKPLGEGDEELFEELIDTTTIGADCLAEDKLEVYTEPNQTNAAAEAISNASKRRIESKEIIWEPMPETMVDVASSDALADFIERLEEDAFIQNIYTNARTADVA